MATSMPTAHSSYVLPQHHRNRTAATVRRYAHVVEGQLVSTAQIAKRIGVAHETARLRAKRGPFPLTWEGLAISGRKA